MKVTIDGEKIAEAADDDLVKIEGSWYFPPSSITPGALSESHTPYICPWRGIAQYYDVTTLRRTRRDAAWSYPDPLESAVDASGGTFRDTLRSSGRSRASADPGRRGAKVGLASPLTAEDVPGR